MEAGFYQPRDGAAPVHTGEGTRASTGPAAARRGSETPRIAYNSASPPASQTLSRRPVFIISDRSGLTAETLSHTLLSQFPDTGFQQRALPFIDSHEKAREAVETINRAGEAAGCRPLVFTTFVDEAFNETLDTAEAEIFDLLSPFIARMERVLGQPSSHKPGQSHSISDFKEYTNRIDAVNFAMHCDDGLHPADYSKASLILIGASRSGKTPTCLYLALHFGFYAANYPLTEEDFSGSRLPEPLMPFRDKAFGLTIDPLRLHQIRTERRPGSEYASLGRCREDVAQAETMFRRNNIPFCDSTNFSVEELGSTIKHQMGLVSSLY